MHVSVREQSGHPGTARRLSRLASLLGGGILLQATAGGCQETWSGIADALGQPIAAGISDGVSTLIQALVVGLI